jgi:uncharacterized repeat protein (TIGR03803 family)
MTRQRSIPIAFSLKTTLRLMSWQPLRKVERSPAVILVMIDRATPQLLSRCALGVSAAAILLAGCSRSQAPAAPGAMPQVRGIAAPSYDVLFSFDGSDGAEPAASLIDVNGTLYGTTQDGGTHTGGTVFALSP